MGPAKQVPVGAVPRSDAADPKLLRLFDAPSADVKVEPEKLLTDTTEAAAENRELLEVVN